MNAVQKNLLRTRTDLINLFHTISQPLKPHFSKGHTRLHVGDTNAHFGHDIAGMETFSRVLWGMVPLLAGGGETKLLEDYLEGIRNGTDPEHEEYWGKVDDFDQRLVEMAVFGYALALVPDKVWGSLTKKEKNNVYQWLNQINEKEIVPSNWQFFRILVNVGFEHVGLPYDKGKQEEALDKIESYYSDNGWYSDGQTAQQDYYIPFAFHFYGLIYAKLMKEIDPKRSQRFVDRASIFANDFLYWFASDGSALPFGRSLTYRFAQGAFWSALAFAEVEVLDWGVVKGIVLRHLRWWMNQSIFSKDGLLTIGYTYPNLLMAENYNSPGSPYWALKTFLLLALEENHPFWLAEEKPFPKLQKRKVQKQPRMILFHNENQDHVFALTSGQFLKSIHGQNDAKYAKFAYSNQFGFCVQRGNDGVEQGAFDSMLALSERDGYYRVRKRCEVLKWENGSLYSLWKPWKDVTVETWLVPIDEHWHVRVHRLSSERELDTIEGGFSIPWERPDFPTGRGELTMIEKEKGYVSLPWGVSGIVPLYGDRQPKVVKTDPNTNVLYSSSTFIPSLKGLIEKGVTWYGAAVFGYVGNVDVTEVWKEAPSLVTSSDGHNFDVLYRGNVVHAIRNYL
ncbi:DUF2264 domain-containing protein [Paenalkalicoccus suaedae]|uniref:DUF2264 domain-containing protein n=1 Tax=Paenalkalicoccus suaedae TaxID=2592382 RepID=A0A859FCJ7_9BACI|nr:DUF2264 domain-containing protein [Paenalkalicoccus suaedae]QKS70294.1 DUF2264 domain-containing protein [Paenalkalicoccus suaedae]